MKITEQPYYARLAFILLSIVLSYLILTVGDSVLIPIAFAFLVALVLLPVVNFLRRKARFPDGLAIAVSVVGLLLFLIGIVYLLSFQIADLSQDFPALQDKVALWTKQLQSWGQQRYHLTARDQKSYLQKVSDTLMSGAASTAGALALSLGHFLFWTAITFIYAFFILSFRKLIIRFITSLFPSEHRLVVRRSFLETKKVVNGYVQGLLTETVIVAIAVTLSLSLMGIQYAFLLGLLAGVLNIIPYLGFISVLVFTGLLTLVHHPPATALLACVVLLVIHLLDSNVLAPRVIGGRVRMNPLATLICIFIGELIWGLSGLFLAIPFAAVLKVVFSHVEGLQPWAMVMGTEADAPAQGDLLNEPEPVPVVPEEVPQQATARKPFD